MEVDFTKAPPITENDLTIFDANDDGDFDLVYNPTSGPVTLFNQGDGNFVFDAASDSSIAAAGSYPVVSPAVQDFNGDGLLDIVEFTETGANGTEGELSIALATSEGVFAPAIILSNEFQFLPPAIFDYDGDGDSDVLYANQEFFNVGTIQAMNPPVCLDVFLNDGTGAFSLAEKIQLSDEIVEGVNLSGNVVFANTLQALDYADFDGDGQLDVFASFRYGFQVFGSLGDTFESQTLFGDDENEEFWNLDDLIIADFNGDQRPDFSILDKTVGGVYLWLNESGDKDVPLIPTLLVEVAPIIEDGGSYRVTFSLEQPAKVEVGTNFVLESGTAILNEDFEPAPTNYIGFAPGETTTAQYFHLIDDKLEEGDEVYFLRFMNPMGLVYSEEVVSLVIQDDESDSSGGADFQLQQWRVLHFGSASNSGDAADNFDFDRDGSSNFLEFALATNPTIANSRPIDFEVNEANSVLTYSRNANAVGAYDFQVVWSDTLSEEEWSSDAVTEEVISEDGNIQQVRAFIQNNGATQRFFRLEVSQQ